MMPPLQVLWIEGDLEVESGGLGKMELS